MGNTAKEIGIKLKETLVKKFYDDQKNRENNDSSIVADQRASAIEIFNEIGFPSKKLESWRKTDISNILEKKYVFDFENDTTKATEDILKCNINNYNTDHYIQVNGKWTEESHGITSYEDGTVVGSISSAMHAYPELFDKYFGKCVKNDRNGLIAINSALFSEGYFIYIPDNVEHDKAIQIVNLIDTQKNIFSNNRNLILVGKNAKLRIVHCDDSADSQTSLINNVTEIHIEEGGKLDFYKMQNKDDDAAILTNTFVKQKAYSDFQSNTIVLNGGVVRNDTHVTLEGGGANADVMGLYLMDRKQFVDNHIFIDHAVANCTSSQLLKGIVDDSATSVFNGHTLVRKDAQNTVAHQNNNNIQLTTNSTINTHPFLEIYADDVKCSHGATVGQLDENALFYLKQRGICDRNANMLLMIAFVGEIIDKIKLPNLRNNIGELVRKRLKGELRACDQCSLHCANPDQPIEFEIDESKI